jgi:hypothetical protein
VLPVILGGRETLAQRESVESRVQSRIFESKKKKKKRSLEKSTNGSLHQILFGRLNEWI